MQPNPEVAELMGDIMNRVREGSANIQRWTQLVTDHRKTITQERGKLN